MFRLTEAAKAAKAAMEELYDGNCVVYSYVDTEDAQTGEMRKTKQILYSGPCRLSRTAALYRRSMIRFVSGEQLSYDAILFLPADAQMAAGCVVTVTQGGAVLRFQQAGDPSRYKTHMEVKVQRVERA